MVEREVLALKVKGSSPFSRSRFGGKMTKHSENIYANLRKLHNKDMEPEEFVESLVKAYKEEGYTKDKIYKYLTELKASMEKNGNKISVNIPLDEF